MTDTGNLTTALAKVQAALPEVAKDKTATVKTKTGGEYSYSYADLASVSRAILPELAANGLAWVTKPTYVGDNFVLQYQLRHVGGECEQGDYPLPDPGHAEPQTLGSAITYARRYTLCSVVGIVPDDDDDAQVAQGQAAGAKRQRKAHNDLAPTSAGSSAAESATVVAVSAPEPVFQPNETAVALIGKILQVEDPWTNPPKGIVIPQWMWELAGETDESLDTVPWGSVRKLAGEKESDLLELLRAFAKKHELDPPGSLAQVKGPVARELQMHLLEKLAEEPF